EMMVDQNKMEQVFLNIILNAVQAMDGKPGALAIGTLSDNGECEISYSCLPENKRFYLHGGNTPYSSG
ncbi:hypothetical protein HKBW3S03_02106, partial [Candidatus Hakubella thermalkaliphila]